MQLLDLSSSPGKKKVSMKRKVLVSLPVVNISSERAVDILIFVYPSIAVKELKMAG